MSLPQVLNRSEQTSTERLPALLRQLREHAQQYQRELNGAGKDDAQALGPYDDASIRAKFGIIMQSHDPRLAVSIKRELGFAKALHKLAMGTLEEADVPALFDHHAQKHYQEKTAAQLVEMAVFERDAFHQQRHAKGCALFPENNVPAYDSSAPLPPEPLDGEEKQKTYAELKAECTAEYQQYFTNVLETLGKLEALIKATPPQDRASKFVEMYAAQNRNQQRPASWTGPRSR